MVEIADMDRVFGETDRKRSFYRFQMVKHFGHLEPNAMVQLMKNLRDAHKNNIQVNQLHDQLTAQMLIVGGENEITDDQLTIAMEAYRLDRPAWNTIVAQYEDEQRGKNHG